MAKRVVDEVAECLTDAVRVDMDPACRVQVDVQPDTLVLVAVAGRVGGRGGDRGRIHRTRIEAQVSLLGVGDCPDVFGEPSQPVRRGTQHRDGVGVEMSHAVLERFEVGVDGRQGRAHLVGEVGEHATSRDFGSPESIGEPVVRAGECGELGSEAGVVDVRVIAASGDLRRGIGDVAD